MIAAIPQSTRGWWQEDYGALCFEVYFAVFAAITGLTSMSYGLPGLSPWVKLAVVLTSPTVLLAIAFLTGVTNVRNQHWLQVISPILESCTVEAVYLCWTLCVLEPEWRVTSVGQRPRGAHLNGLEPVLQNVPGDPPVGGRPRLDSPLLEVAPDDLPGRVRLDSPLPSIHSEFHYLWVGLFPLRLDELKLSSRFSVYRRPLLMYFLCTLFKMGFVLIYESLVWFMSAFRSRLSNPDGSLLVHTTLFLIFTVAVMSFQLVYKIIGFTIDRGKRGGCSFYYMAEVFVLFNYQIFYRNLFSTPNLNPYLFGSLLFVHCGFEWVKYAFRATDTYYDFMMKTWTRFTALIPQRFADRFHQSDMTYEQWVPFVALEYGIRVVAFVYSLVAYMSIFTFLRYNRSSRSFYRFSRDYTDEQYRYIMLCCAISFFIETINASLLQICVYRPRGIGVLQRVVNLFACSKMRLFVFLCSAVSGLNVIAAFP